MRLRILLHIGTNFVILEANAAKEKPILPHDGFTYTHKLRERRIPR
jgi:hypothetical protein